MKAIEILERELEAHFANLEKAKQLTITITTSIKEIEQALEVLKAGLK